MAVTMMAIKVGIIQTRRMRIAMMMADTANAKISGRIIIATEITTADQKALEAW
jgi:hypothetical protein